MKKRKRNFFQKWINKTEIIEEEKISQSISKLPKINKLEKVKNLKKLKTEIKDDINSKIEPLKNADNNTLVMISETDFQEKFESTYYFQKFSETERSPPVDEAIWDLLELFTGITINMIEKQYNLYKTKSDVKTITSIWTWSG